MKKLLVGHPVFVVIVLILLASLFGATLFEAYARFWIGGGVMIIMAFFAIGFARYVETLDAEPEIEQLKPYGYIVNEDGDKDVKRQYCEQNEIEYIVLKREPKPGLIRRMSTDFRGF